MANPFEKAGFQELPPEQNPFEKAGKKELAAPETISKLESGVRGFGQGVSLGFGDEIVGGVEGAFDALTSKKKLLDAYRQHRDESRANNKAAHDANPWTYGIGEAGGGLATMAIPGAGAAKLLNPTTIKGMAALGGALGLGGSDADLTKGEYGRAAFDTGVGTALGGTVGAVGKGLGKGATYLGGKIEKGLESASSRAQSKVAEKLATEGQSLVGALGAETQKGSRQIENLMRLRELVDPATRDAIDGLLKSPAAADLAGSLAQHTLSAAPEQLGKVAGAKAASEAFQSGFPAALEKGTEEALSGSEAKKQIMDRVKRYAAPWAGGIAANYLLPDEMSGPAKFGVGLLAGRGASPTIDALRRMAMNPAVQTRALRAAQKLLGTGHAAQKAGELGLGSAIAQAEGDLGNRAVGLGKATLAAAGNEVNGAAVGFASSFPDLAKALGVGQPKPEDPLAMGGR